MTNPKATISHPTKNQTANGKILKKVKTVKSKPTVPAAVHPRVHRVSAKKQESAEVKVLPPVEISNLDDGRYIFATGRRKTSIANVRVFQGKGENLVNKKPLEKFFSYGYYRQEILQPLSATGLEDKFHFVGHVQGGGARAQAQALRHGIAIALSKVSEEVRKVLKKNGFLTRDDRKKERKKPGLKRARRAPQWSKR